MLNMKKCLVPLLVQVIVIVLRHRWCTSNCESAQTYIIWRHPNNRWTLFLISAWDPIFSNTSVPICTKSVEILDITKPTPRSQRKRDIHSLYLYKGKTIASSLHPRLYNQQQHSILHPSIMAYSANNFTLFLLISLLSTFHSHARDSQLFNKVPSTTTTTTTNVPYKEDPLSSQEQEPNFLPQNENGYGLYGHESGQLPPSTTITTTATMIPYNTKSERPLNKYLPENYNPVAYVTESQDKNNGKGFTEESYSTRTNNDNNNYYNGVDSFNERPEPKGTRFNGGGSYSTTLNNRENYYNNGGRPNFEPQGLSDTRSMENGKYFYDVNSGKYSSDHPYESLKGVRTRNEYNNKNYNGNKENSYEYNDKYSTEGQYRDEFQDEADMPWNSSEQNWKWISQSSMVAFNMKFYG